MSEVMEKKPVYRAVVEIIVVEGQEWATLSCGHIVAVPSSPSMRDKRPCGKCSAA